MEQSPGPNERGLLKFLDQLDQESHQAKEQLASASWERYLQIERGQDWPDRNKAPMWKANPIKTTVARKAALLTETKPHNRILPRRSGLEATATILEKAIDAGWEEYNLEQILEFNAKTMGVLGCGFLKLPYDRHADYGAGDVVPVAVDPRNVRIDPAVTQSHELANAQYLIVDSIEPVWSLWRKYPGRGALVTPDPRYSSLYSGPERPTGMWAWAASKLTTVVRPQPSTEPGAIPRAYIREYQFHDPTLNDDGTPRYPAGRFVIRAGDDVILEDRPNPYWDGGWDLEMVDTMPDLDHPWGTSEVEALRRIQEALNRVMDLFVRNRVATGNMRIEADHNALEPDTVGLLKSLNAVVLTKRFGTNLNVVMPENMPADMLQFADLSIKLMDYLSGLSEPTIDGRFEVRSGVQFEGLQAAQQTLVRATARRMENYLQRIGQKWISRIFQFYTNDRLMSYLGPGPTFQTFAFERQMLMRELVTKVRGELQRKAIEDSAAIPPDLLREEIERATRMAFRDFRFKVTPGSSLASTKLQRAMLFAQLAMNGVLSRTKVLEELGFASPEEEIERAMREAQVLGMPSQKGRKGQSA